jgi:carbamate kinase
MSESTSRPSVPIAMGGHAFMVRGEAGDVRDREWNAVAIYGSLMTLVERDYNLVITHGNGP